MCTVQYSHARCALSRRIPELLVYALCVNPVPFSFKIVCHWRHSSLCVKFPNNYICENWSCNINLLPTTVPMWSVIVCIYSLTLVCIHFIVVAMMVLLTAILAILAVVYLIHNCRKTNVRRQMESQQYNNNERKYKICKQFRSLSSLVCGQHRDDHGNGFPIAMGIP